MSEVFSHEDYIFAAEQCIKDGETDIAVNYFLETGQVELNELKIEPEIKSLLADRLGQEGQLVEVLEPWGKVKPAAFKAALVGGAIATASWIGYSWEADPDYHRSMLQGLSGLAGTAAVLVGLEGITNFPVLRRRYFKQREEQS